jgi:hypothetical protein
VKLPRFRAIARCSFCLGQEMSIKAKPSKRRGRPATGRDPMMGFRAAPVLRASIVRWAEDQPDMPTLSEATRRLVELGLTIKMNAKQRPAGRADRAKELAARTIEKMIDPSVSPEDRTQRRRRLTKGPLEFREARVDLPKARK